MDDKGIVLPIVHSPFVRTCEPLFESLEKVQSPSPVEASKHDIYVARPEAAPATKPLNPKP